MTLQIINSTTAGATQDLSSRVFMASDRLNLPPFSITQNAEEGSVAHSTLVVDDPSGNLTLKGHRRVYFVETSAPAGQQVIGNTYIGTKTIDRGDWNVGPLARSFSVQLADANTLIGRRLMVGADANRPAETDVQRVQWLLTTTEANEFNASNTYINTANPVSMDAADYRQQNVNAILNDCSQASHKNYWVIYVESLGEFSLWYDWDYSATYSSTIRLSNDEADIDDSTTFAYFHTSTLTQDPSRVYSGTLVPFQPANTETTSWVYETQVSTGAEFVYRDVSYPSVNVHTEAKARARAQRYNANSDEEDDVVHVSFVVPAAKVNAYMHGHRIETKGTHWGFTGGNDYTTFTWMRGLNRTVTQLSSTHYRIDADLSPIVTPCTGEQTYNVPTPSSAKSVYVWELVGANPTPIDSLSVTQQANSGTFNPGTLTAAGNETEVMLLYGYCMGNNTDSDGPGGFNSGGNFSSTILNIDHDKKHGIPPGDYLLPESVAGHRLLTSPTAGEYAGTITYSGFSRWGANALAFKAAAGETLEIRQTKYQEGLDGNNQMTFTLDSPPLKDSILVVWCAVRQGYLGNEIGVITGFTGLTQVDTHASTNAGTGGRLMYGTVACI